MSNYIVHDGNGTRIGAYEERGLAVRAMRVAGAGSIITKGGAILEYHLASTMKHKREWEQRKKDGLLDPVPAIEAPAGLPDASQSLFSKTSAPDPPALPPGLPICAMGGCAYHRGPHWVYVDFQWSQSNRESFSETGSLRGHAQEELNRLQVKKIHLARCGTIPEEIVAQAIEDWRNEPLLRTRDVLSVEEPEIVKLERSLQEDATAQELAEGSAREALTQRIVTGHARLATLKTRVEKLRAIIAEGPRPILTPQEVAERAVPKMGRVDCEALMESAARRARASAPYTPTGEQLELWGMR